LSGGNWFTAGNWSPVGVPTAGDFVKISGKSVNLSASATVSSLTITGGAQLTLGQNGNRLLRTSALSIDFDSKLDLKDNDLTIDYPGASPMGTWNDNDLAYDGVTGMILSGQITSSATGALMERPAAATWDPWTLGRIVHTCPVRPHPPPLAHSWSGLPRPPGDPWTLGRVAPWVTAALTPTARPSRCASCLSPPTL
jgi:hypothetical protein